MTFCPKCGGKIPKESSFCIHCGADIKELIDYRLEGEEIKIEEVLKEARQKYKSGKYLEALKNLEPLLESDDMTALLLASSCYEGLEQYEKALNCIDKVSILDRDSKVSYQKSYLLYELRRYKEARDVAGKILLYMNPDEEVKMGTVDLLKLAGEKRAYQALRNRHEKELKDVYGENYRHAKDIIWDLRNLEVELNLYKEGGELKKLEEAEKRVKKLRGELKNLKVKQKSEKSEKEQRLRIEAVKEICEKGWKKLKSKNYNEVLKDLKTIIDSPWGISQEAEAMFLASRCYNKIDEYEKELEYIDKALKIKPTSGRFWIFKGRVLEHMQNYEDSLDCFDNASATEATDLSLGSSIDALIQKGQVCMHMKKYEKALECFDEAFMRTIEWGVKNKIPEIHLRRAWAFFELERYKDAKDCAMRGMETNPEGTTKKGLIEIIEKLK